MVLSSVPLLVNTNPDPVSPLTVPRKVSGGLAQLVQVEVGLLGVIPASVSPSSFVVSAGGFLKDGKLLRTLSIALRIDPVIKFLIESFGLSI